MANYNTFTTYDGDGVTSEFAIPFAYDDNSEVIVYLDGVPSVSHSFLSPGMITFGTPPQAGVEVLVVRDTNITNPAVIWQNNKTVIGPDVNTLANQTIKKLQELSSEVEPILPVLGLIDDIPAKALQVAADAATTSTKASEASASASSAASNATAAAASESSASTSATTASTKASEASASATTASDAAATATSAKSAAEAARDATLQAFDNFDDRYLGAKSTPPTLDNDGAALVAGSLYFDTVSESMKVYTGSAWVAAYIAGTDFVSKTGDTMTGTLNLPSNGLTVGTDQLLVSGGNVGIGTSSPAQKLTVAGTIESTSGGFKFPDGTTQTTVAAGVPTGTMAAFTDDPGSGWLACDGSIYAKSAYPALGAILDKYILPPRDPSDLTALSATVVTDGNSHAIVNGYAFTTRYSPGYARIDLSTGTVTNGNQLVYDLTGYGSSFKDFIAYNGSIYCAFGGTNTTMYSADGASWTYSTSYTGLQPYYLTWDGTYFLGARLALSTPCRRSTNGATWSSAGNLPANYYSTIASNGTGTTVVAGNSTNSRTAYSGNISRMAYTTNGGTTWTQSTLPSGTEGTLDIYYLNNKFIAVSGLTGQFLTSSDGISWTLIHSNYKSEQYSPYTCYLEYYDGWYYLEGVGVRSKNLRQWYNIWETIPSYFRVKRIDPATGTVYAYNSTYGQGLCPYQYNTSTHFAVPRYVISNAANPVGASSQTFFIKT